MFRQIKLQRKLIQKTNYIKHLNWQNFMLIRIIADKHKTQFKIWFEKKENTFLEEEIEATTANP